MPRVCLRVRISRLHGAAVEGAGGEEEEEAEGEEDHSLASRAILAGSVTSDMDFQ